MSKFCKLFRVLLRRTWFVGEEPTDRYTGLDILKALLLLAMLLTIFSVAHSLE